MKRGTLLSIIVPCYRNAGTIENDLHNLFIALSYIDMQWEIIVVADGIEDKTFDRASAYAKKHKSVQVIGYKTNRGKGYAVRYGMAKSKGEIIGFIDAGGDIRPESITMLLEHFRWYNADIIIGSKLHPVSKVSYPLPRKILSWGYRLFVRGLFGLNIRDSQVGMKLFRRVVLEDVMPRLLVKKFAFDIEMLAVAHHLGYTHIYEAPVELDFTGASSITSWSVWKTIWNMLWDTFAVYYRLKILRYYDNSNKRKWVFDPELNYKVNIG